MPRACKNSPLLLLVLLFVAAWPARAQEAPRHVVMNLAAHPDDEDGATLAYYRHAQNDIAYSVIFTRGEGGQNEIGPELYEELGALRTQETEAAARILGTQLFFLNFKDFGFSKTAEETFDRWGGRDRVTARLVHLIRTLKPDVLFTNHDTVSQHGHHQAVGLAAHDAFALAADSAYHPEQLEEPGVDLWQPKRLFLRRWRDAAGIDVRIPVGEVDPATGQTYAARAGAALRVHRSQGMAMFAERIEALSTTNFVLLRSATEAPLDPHDLTGNLPPNRTAQPSLTYQIDSGRLPALPPDAFTLSDTIAVPGQPVRLQWTRGALPSGTLRWHFHGAIDTVLDVEAGTPASATLLVRPDAVPTLPRAERQYDRFVSRAPVYYALYHDGTLTHAGYLPLDVAPPVVVAFERDVVRLRPGTNALPFRARGYDPQAERLQLNAAVSRDAAGTIIYQRQTECSFGADDALRDTLMLQLPASLAPGAYTITLTGVARPSLQAPVPARAQIPAHVFAPIETPPALHVGVIASYDDALEQALQELGVTYTVLDSLDLARGRFDGLHTVLVDIRAYLVRPDLRLYNDRLLDWVQRGGHLIINYQKTFEWNAGYEDPFHPDQQNPGTFAPFSLVLGRDRVTREDAPVDVLRPEHPLFNQPNPITAADWEGWVQERGLYFPAAYDGRYQELLRMNDPDEPPLRSAMLLARYGEGTYLYTPLVWYRQLKALHPGAYKLFANMISLPFADRRNRSTD